MVPTTAKLDFGYLKPVSMKDHDPDLTLGDLKLTPDRQDLKSDTDSRVDSDAPIETLRRKPPLNIPTLAARIHPGIATTVEQIEPFAQRWDNQNVESYKRLTSGVEPLKVWLILGDSICQGIGADIFEHGWVQQVERRLNTSDNGWVLLNFSMSGGRYNDVTKLQIPAFEKLGITADLVTCVVGGNDLMWRVNSRSVRSDAQLLAEKLGVYAHTSTLTVAATAPEISSRSSRSSRVNEIFEEAAAPYTNFDLVDIWQWTETESGICRDHIHPSTSGYQIITETMWNHIKQIAP